MGIIYVVEIHFAWDEEKNRINRQKLKEQSTADIDHETMVHFKKPSKEVGIPRQARINLYLSDCMARGRTLTMPQQ